MVSTSTSVVTDGLLFIRHDNDIFSAYSPCDKSTLLLWNQTYRRGPVIHVRTDPVAIRSIVEILDLNNAAKFVELLGQPTLSDSKLYVFNK